MPDEEITLAELKAGLDLAAETNQVINYKGKFTAAPQLPKGKSFWAEKLRNKEIDSTDVCWAFIDGEKKVWMAIRVLSNGVVKYFNLQNDQDRATLKELENSFGQ